MPLLNALKRVKKQLGARALVTPEELAFLLENGIFPISRVNSYNSRGYFLIFSSRPRPSNRANEKSNKRSQVLPVFLTMNTALQQLRNCVDISDLKPALMALCSRFGSISRLDILAASQSGKRQALCFLRLDSAEQEQQLMNELGVGRFAGDLVVIVDLYSNEAAKAGFTSHHGSLSSLSSL